MPVNSFEHYPMSWRPRIERSGFPLYLEIARLLERDIGNGALKPNDKLPPQRELADFLDVNVSTITRAFQICEAKGLISGSVGRGTYVSSDVSANMPMLSDDDGQGFIDLGASHPLYRQNTYVSQLLKKLPSKINVENLLRYCDISGTPGQKESGRKWLEKYGICVKSEAILITSGLQNSLAVILASLFKAGDKIAVNSVIYPGFKNMANMLGIRLVPVPYEGKAMDLAYLERICRNESIKGVYMTPDIQNPTALTMDGRERERLGGIIRQNSLIGIEDGTYTFLNENQYAPLYQYAPDYVIHICTVSNSLSAGLRISFLAPPGRFREKLLTGIRNINVMSPPLDAEIVSQLIRTGLADDMVREKTDEIRKRNAVTEKVLKGFELWGNERCQFRWLVLPEGINNYRLEKQLHERKIKVFCSDRFLVGNAECRQALRLAVCSPETVPELEQGLHTIKQTIKDMRHM